MAHQQLLQKIDMQLNTVYSDYIYFSSAKRDIFTTNNNHMIYNSSDLIRLDVSPYSLDLTILVLKIDTN